MNGQNFSVEDLAKRIVAFQQKAADPKSLREMALTMAQQMDAPDMDAMMKAYQEQMNPQQEDNVFGGLK